MKTRGKGIFIEDWYSICSGHGPDETEDTCTRCQAGMWRNRLIAKFSSFIYDRWPNLWRWWIKLPLNRKRRVKERQKHFPNLK
jgi:hypothetical protein